MKPPETHLHNTGTATQHSPGPTPIVSGTPIGPYLSPDAYALTMIVSPKILTAERSRPTVSPAEIHQSHETCRLIVQAMTPTETLIAACRWQQLPDTIPAALLGISTRHVNRIMHQLKHRLTAQYPYLRVSIQGRHRNRTHPNPD